MSVVDFWGEPYSSTSRKMRRKTKKLVAEDTRNRARLFTTRKKSSANAHGWFHSTLAQSCHGDKRRDCHSRMPHDERFARAKWERESRPGWYAEFVEEALSALSGSKAVQYDSVSIPLCIPTALTKLPSTSCCTKGLLCEDVPRLPQTVLTGNRECQQIFVGATVPQFFGKHVRTQDSWIPIYCSSFL